MLLETIDYGVLQVAVQLDILTQMATVDFVGVLSQNLLDEARVDVATALFSARSYVARIDRALLIAHSADWGELANRQRMAPIPGAVVASEANFDEAVAYCMALRARGVERRAFRSWQLAEAWAVGQSDLRRAQAAWSHRRSSASPSRTSRVALLHS